MMTRCTECGSSKPCSHTYAKRVEVATRGRDYRRFCKHDYKEVYGVPTWRYMCTKCGAMCR